MKYEPTGGEQRVIWALNIAFLSCVLARTLIVRRIVLDAGMKWKLPLSNREAKTEMKIVKALHPSLLKTQYQIVIAVGICVATAYFGLVAWICFGK